MDLAQDRNGAGQRVEYALVASKDARSLASADLCLAAAGYNAIVAHSGDDALRAARDRVLSIVVVDQALSDAGGLDLCRALRSDECIRKLYVIMLISGSDEQHCIDALEGGADDYITKPVDCNVLSARLVGARRILELAARVEADAHTMMQQVAELGLLTRKLRTAALTDVETGLPNRRYAMKRLEQEVERSWSTGEPLSLVMIDLDNLKSINDTHGHAAGGAVMRAVGGVLRTATREGEAAALWGGDEFVVMCNAAAGDSLATAERIRLEVASSVAMHDGVALSVTLSAGVASLSASARDAKQLIGRAYGALHLAKSQGRNSCVVAVDVPA